MMLSNAGNKPARGGLRNRKDEENGNNYEYEGTTVVVDHTSHATNAWEPPLNVVSDAIKDTHTNTNDEPYDFVSNAYFSNTSKDSADDFKKLTDKLEKYKQYSIYILEYIKYKTPYLSNLFVSESSGQYNPSNEGKVRKTWDIIRYTMIAFCVLSVIMLASVYFRRSTKTSILYTEIETKHKYMNARRWDMSPCKNVKLSEIEIGRINLLMNSTHVYYVDFTTLMESQIYALQMESDWTDVVCASMLPNTNISMPCSCTFEVDGNVISGFDFHIESSSKSKARITEHVPVMGHQNSVSTLIPKKITMSYYDWKTKKREELALEGANVSVGMRAVTLMNDVKHYKSLLRKS